MTTLETESFDSLLPVREPGSKTSLVVNDLAFSPHGSALAVLVLPTEPSGAPGFIEIWDTRTQTRTRSLTAVPTIGSYAGGLAFSPDGRLLATPGPGNPLCVWDVARGKPILQPNAGSGATAAVTFDRRGMLASVTEDGTVRLWRVNS